jgi:putative Holliday junction resolvase
MAILGIDWGEAKLGLALSVGKMAEPYEVVRYSDLTILKEVLAEIVKRHEIDKIVVGVSEGKSEEAARRFGKNLKKLGIEVVFFDETLSSLEAQKLSREAKVKRKKAKALEDAFAAAVMLQSFLDSNV